MIESLNTHTKEMKMKNENKLHSDAFLLLMAGKTSVAFLDSTLKRLAEKYCTRGYLGTKQSDYNSISGGWSGFAWDIMLMRASVNYLMHEGYNYQDAVSIIREIIYVNVYPIHKEGRPEGVKGEKVGDGRKKNGTRKKFNLGKHKREWVQIGMTNAIGTILDMMGAYRQHQTGRSYVWSRQKIATFMSMSNKHEQYHHPRMEEFFYSDEVL